MNTEAKPAGTTSDATKYLVLLGAIIVQLILGTVYGYSLFWQPLQSELGLPIGQANYAFSICILSFALVMVIAGKVQDIKGPRFPAITGAVLLGIGFIVASLTLGKLGDKGRLFLLWGTVGFLAGAGIGFAYVCPIAALVKWFPKSKGLVSGLAVAGFGFGAYIFSHKTLPFSAENYIKAHGIQQFFLLHGIVAMIAICIGAMLLRNPPGVGSKAAAAGGESTWQDTLKQPAFYILWLMFFSGAMAGLMVIGILKPFAGNQLVAAATEALTEEGRLDLLARGVKAVGWLAIFNAVGRVVWGLISDKVGRTTAFAAMFLFQAVMMFLLIKMQTELSLAVAASLIGFNFGGNFALFPSATADFFGAKNLGANYGWVFTSYGIAGVVGIAAGNMAKNLTGSYGTAFAVAGGLCVLSAILAIVLHKLPKPTQTNV